MLGQKTDFRQIPVDDIFNGERALATLMTVPYQADEAGEVESVQLLQARFPDSVLATEDFRDQQAVTVKADALLGVARFLRDEMGYDMLLDDTSYDRLNLGQEPRFVGVYELRSVRHNRQLRLLVPAPDDKRPVLPSLTKIWPTANWHEREAFDLMGIRYKGHPDLKRILMPDNWVGHPLRKDYDINREEVPFSVNWEAPEFENLGKQILEPVVPVMEIPDGMDHRHLVINMGPQHPSTHGVLRLIAELEGEKVVRVDPDLGYLHSGFEKQGENVRWKDFVYYTDRMDYLSSMSNNLGYVLAVETLLGIEVPPRAKALRVIMAELQRIASHLVALGTAVLDLSGTSMAFLMYAFRERELITDIFEMVSGGRLTLSYMRIGGLAADVPPAFDYKVRQVLEVMPSRIDEYERMLTDSVIFRGRTEGVGPLSAEDALALGVTGPMLRASGVPYDLRRVRPYCGYEQYDFDVVTETGCDVFSRYLVRVNEMRQSLRIIQQALDNLPAGPVNVDNRKVVPPPREELDHDMEALIHHFKLWTEGMKTPPGSIYHAVENPKGILGFFLVSDGSAHPYRLRVRGPSFVNLQALNRMASGQYVADLIASLGSVDIVLGEVDR